MFDQEMHSQFSQRLQTAADEVWVRFVESMPERYFRETDRETQLAHLHMLTACEASGIEQDLVVKSPGGDTWTFLTQRSYPGQLGEMLSRLPEDRMLTSARAYTSRDGKLVLDIFELGDHQPEAVSDEEFQATVDSLSQGLAATESARFKEHLRGCSPEYLRSVPPRISQIHFRLINDVKATGDLQVDWEEIDDNLDTVRFAVEGTQAKNYFERLARYLGIKGIDIERAYLTSFHEGPTAYRYLGFTVRNAQKHPRPQLTEDLKRLYFVDDSVVDLWSEVEGFSLSDCEVVDYLTSLSHQLLCGKDPVKFARPRLLHFALKYKDQLLPRVACFKEGRTPESPVSGLDREEEAEFFQTWDKILTSVLFHNLDQGGRQALGARLKPELFRESPEERPYAVIFARGQDCHGFHVRFQDVARGGMRLVCPNSNEAHTAENERLFEEAYSLARAQHLKNKDIPEGGAKAAVLVRPGTDPTRAGRLFANTLLDLTVGAPTADNNPDLIYLGPDENVSTDLIEWIANRAALRGHPLPASFMSSKPGAGINHKEFGITSEGVTVFLEESLRQKGLNPETDPFTVTITGGPDGDVAGNEIRILLTRYPQTARIIGVADGSGSAEDPQGLNAEELLRLFQSVSPIAQFDPQHLSPEGRVVPVSSPGGVELRNSLHNRLQADAFVPAGGRPATINKNNWQKFCQQDGKPASYVIVEGANLFLTEDARRELSSIGVSIIKDSSANKCGVVCSSFEVLASMLLTEEEFLKHKKEFVGQVIDRLQQLARSEATLLFREHKRRPDLCLPTLSVRLSKVMLRTAEAVAREAADPLSEESQEIKEVFLNYLPPLLRQLAGNRLHQIPLDYRQRIVACSLSGKIVYREGITYLEDLPTEALNELALTYLKGERVVQSLVDEVRASGIPSASKLAALLELGGARTLAQSPELHQ